MTTEIQDVIRGLKNLNLEKPGEQPIIDLMRPWLMITDLELMDAIHLSPDDLASDLLKIRNALSEVLDVMDGDQIQEAACRKIEKINVYGDMIQDKDVAERAKITINWDGGKWVFITDPKLRMTESSSSYMTAKRAVFKMLDR